MNRFFPKVFFLCGLLSAGLAYAQPAAPSAPPSAPQAPAGAPGKSTRAGSLEQAIKGDNSQDQLPMLIRSDNFQLDSKNRIFHYKDNVEVVKGDLTITSDIMTGKYDENSQLKEMVCENNVVVTRGDRLRATSQRAVYDIPKDVITMTEGPELNDKGNVLDADKVTILVKDDRSFAEGHVRVKVTKGNEQNNMMKSIQSGPKKEGAEGASGATGSTGGSTGSTGSTGVSGSAGGSGETGTSGVSAGAQPSSEEEGQ